MKQLLLFLCYFWFLQPLIAQNDTTRTKQDKALKLYFDCTDCDREYIKQQIKFVNHVRNRNETDVQIIIASQETGSGGQHFSLFFLGNKAFKTKNDTLFFDVVKATTKEEIRKKTVQTMKLGLIPYVAKTPFAEDLNISFLGDSTKKNGQVLTDKWKHWSFTGAFNGYMQGDQNYKNSNYTFSFSANKVTEKFKVNLSIRNSISKNTYHLDDSTTVYSNFRNQRFDGTFAWALNKHWSAGMQGGVASSLYQNYKIALGLRPAIEYDFYPYKESNSKLLTLFYIVGPYHYAYNEETIYGKTSENLFAHRLDLSALYKQKWGSLSAVLSASSYLHDFSKNQISLFNNLEWNITKGLSFQLSAQVAWIHDQLALPKGTATPQEVLLQQRQLASAYNYFVYVGLSYTFGSIYNNIVNPRFSGVSQNLSINY